MAYLKARLHLRTNLMQRRASVPWPGRTAMSITVFGESLDELANRQRARIWLPFVGSHSGGIVS